MSTHYHRRKLNHPRDHLTVQIDEVHTGLRGLFKVYRVKLNRTFNDIAVLASLLLSHIVYLIARAVNETADVKAQLRCTVKFRKALDSQTTTQAYFCSKQSVCLYSTDTEAQYAMAMAEIHKKIDKFTQTGSGWVVERVMNCDLYLSKYNPIRGSMYTKLPKYLQAKKAIINVQNKDNKCFMWSVLAGLNPVDIHPERVSKYNKYANTLKFDGISHPVALTDIPKFEQQNGIGINVLGYGENGLYPLYSTPTRGIKVVNLLLYAPEGRSAHYCLIKDINRLMFRSAKYHCCKFICQYCLCAYNNQKRLDKHLEYCTVDRQRVEMPDDPVLKFLNVHRQLRAPYVIYADMECHMKRVNDPNFNTYRTLMK